MKKISMENPGSKKIKILLYQQEIPTRYIPLGLSYLAAALENENCEIKILNAAAPYVKFNSKTLLKEIKDFGPHIFGISLTTPFVKIGYSIIKSLDDFDSTLIVSGGPHATLRPEESIDNGSDIAVIGEGEETIKEILRFVRNEITIEEVKGICYKDDTGNPKRTDPREYIADLNAIPLPARNLLDQDEYIGNTRETLRFGPIITSRGCPVGCAFCSNAIFGRRYRFRSPENVFAEIKECYDQYGVRHFQFVDDVFTLPKERVEKLCDLIIADKEMSISWTCLAILKSMSPELLKKMKDAGCEEIAYGIESANKETLKKIHKPVDPELARKVLKWTKEADINVEACFILGYPWEEAKEVYKTLDFMKEIKPYVDFFPNSNILVPYPGTEIYELYHEEYGFTDWWLKEDGFNADYRHDATPAFYQRIYYDDRGQLKKGCSFFTHSKPTWKAIKASVKFVGNTYLDRYPSRISSNFIIQKIFKLILFFMVKTSFILYCITPSFEKKIFTFLLKTGRKYTRISKG